MMRHVFMQAATGGAIIMALLTIGLLVLGWLTRPAAASNRQVASRPKRQAAVRTKAEAVAGRNSGPQRGLGRRPSLSQSPLLSRKPLLSRSSCSKLKARAVPELKPKLELAPVAGPGAAVAGPDVTAAGAATNGHSPEVIDYPSWLAGTAEFDADASELPGLSTADDSGDNSLTDDYSAADYSAADTEIVAPSWLGLVDPEPDPDPSAAPAAPAEPPAGTDADADAMSTRRANRAS